MVVAMRCGSEVQPLSEPEKNPSFFHSAHLLSHLAMGTDQIGAGAAFTFEGE